MDDRASLTWTHPPVGRFLADFGGTLSPRQRMAVGSYRFAREPDTEQLTRLAAMARHGRADGYLIHVIHADPLGRVEWQNFALQGRDPRAAVGHSVAELLGQPVTSRRARALWPDIGLDCVRTFTRRYDGGLQIATEPISIEIRPAFREVRNMP